MTQPRKEQIKDLKTKHTLVDKVGASSAFSGDTYVVVDSGGDTRYTDLLAKTVTGAAGGAEANVRPTLWGGAGPWAASAGQQFAVTIPGVNGGSPVVVTLVSSDVVLISGLPRVTPAKLAARINATLAAVGVSTPVASYELGRVVLRAATAGGPITGPDAYVTVSDVTPGLTAMFGFGTSPASAAGATGPVRGVSCLASDLGGGRAPIVRTDGGPPVPDDSWIHVGGHATAQKFRPAGPVYGRVVSAPLNGSTPNLVVSFYRQGVRPPKIVTAGADFAAMGVSDSITVTVSDTASPGFGSVSFPVSLSAVTSQATFVAAVNAAFDAAVVAATGVSGSSPSKAAAMSAAQPFGLSLDQITIRFGVATPFSTPLSGNSAAEVVSAINSAITGAGLTAVGEALVHTDGSGVKHVVIRSKVADGGTLAITGTGAERIGILNGVVSGFQLCKADGAAEAVLTFPGALGSTLTVTGSSGTMGRLGFSTTTVTSSAAEGEEPVTAPECKLAFPEVMEFWEVPDDHDAKLHSALDVTPSRTVGGYGKDSLWSPLLGALGKVLPGLIPALDQLVAKSMVLGSGKVDVASDQLEPRVVVPRTLAANMVMVADFPDLSGSGYHYRLYVAHTGAPDGLVFTTNARYNGSAWVKDTASLSTLVSLGGAGIVYWADTTAGPTITWKEYSRTDFNGILTVGKDVNGPSDIGLARLFTPALGGALLHVWQNYDSTLGDGLHTQHIYSLSDVAAGQLWISNNAYFSGGVWNSDDTANTASAILFESGRIRIFGQAAGSTTWSSWTHTAFDMDLSDASTRVGKFETGVSLGANLSSTLAHNLIPRIETPFIPSSGTTERTLIHKITPVSSNQAFYVYAGSNSFGSGLGKDLVYVCNAHWDGTNWIREDVSADASVHMMLPGGIRWYIKKAGTGNSWTDSGWTKVMDANSYGMKLGFPDSPTTQTAAAFKNFFHQDLIPKAWGSMVRWNDGFSDLVDDYGSYGITSYAAGGTIDMAIAYLSQAVTGGVVVVSASPAYSGAYGSPPLDGGVEFILPYTAIGGGGTFINFFGGGFEITPGGAFATAQMNFSGSIYYKWVLLGRH